MLLPALLAVLAAAPSSAAPVRPASCLRGASGAAPASLDDLRDCQDRVRADAVNAAESKGKPLTAAQLDKLDDFQRAEARKFLSSSQAVIPDAAPSAKPAASNGKLGGATGADLAKVDLKSAAAIKGLQGRMQAAAGDGKNGVTPAMADDVRATLTQVQGSVSPDMQELLNSVSKDGGKLTPATMMKLQGAGKDAKASGLDLNIDPGTEKRLLESDFSKDATDSNTPPPGM
jgi:hypothetical protein